MKILDTNIILRFIIGDNKEMKDMAIKIINENTVIFPNEFAAKVICVLTKVYKIRASDPDVLKTALNIYKKKPLDFVDCLLIGYHREYGYEVCTFDKKLNKLIEQK